MEYISVKIVNGALELPESIRSSMNLREGEKMVLETNEDGSLTIRKPESIDGIKGLIDKDDIPNIQVNRRYNLQFETTS